MMDAVFVWTFIALVSVLFILADQVMERHRKQPQTEEVDERSIPHD